MTTEHQKYLITGGAGGIGLALTTALVDSGAQVIACGRSAESLAQAKERLPSLMTRQCDVIDPEQRRALVSWLHAEHPDLSVLINNAAVQFRADFSKPVAQAVIDTELQVNFVAPLMLSQELLPLLKRQEGRGLIVNVSSGLAFCPVAAMPIYSASKAALHSVTLSLRHQLAPEGVRVVEIIPPPVDTGLGDHSAKDAIAAGLPVLSPQEFAQEALTRLEGGEDEIAIGLSVATKAKGEELFGVFNRAH